MNRISQFHSHVSPWSVDNACLQIGAFSSLLSHWNWQSTGCPSWISRPIKVPIRPSNEPFNTSIEVIPGKAPRIDHNLVSGSNKRKVFPDSSRFPNPLRTMRVLLSKSNSLHSVQPHNRNFNFRLWIDQFPTMKSKSRADDPAETFTSKALICSF